MAKKQGACSSSEGVGSAPLFLYHFSLIIRAVLHPPGNPCRQFSSLRGSPEQPQPHRTATPPTRGPRVSQCGEAPPLCFAPCPLLLGSIQGCSCRVCAGWRLAREPEAWESTKVLVERRSVGAAREPGTRARDVRGCTWSQTVSATSRTYLHNSLPAVRCRLPLGAAHVEGWSGSVGVCAKTLLILQHTKPCCRRRHEASGPTAFRNKSTSTLLGFSKTPDIIKKYRKHPG